MSDLINGLGARGASAYGLGATRPAGPTAGATPTQTGSETTGAAPASLVEGFSPTVEAGESKQEAQAGEAAASQFASQWSAGGTAPVPSAGQLQVQGAENTTVNQVHGVKDGQHVGSGGPEPGFSGATVFSSRPPA